MNKLVRYGRKIPMPSTAEIKHELKMMAAGDALKQVASDEEVALIVQDLACHHGISSERAWMLVDRFGIGRHDLAEAAQNLQARKLQNAP